MNEQQLQQAFIQFLAQKTGAKTQQELEAAIQQLGEQGLQQAYQEFMQLLQQQQVQTAKSGAKLNYIKELRGQCPEGYEIQYYKSGGHLCKKCMKKQATQEDPSQNPVDQFKCGRKMKKAQGGSVDLEKCGGKAKKPKKKFEGGDISYDKCGGKTKKKAKKKEDGGTLNSTYNPLSFSKMTLAKCGAKLKEACKGAQINKDQKGGNTKRFPLYETSKSGKRKVTWYNDEATRDSIAANKYNDQEVQTMRPGSYKKNKQGKTVWTPDRTKSPYKKK